MKEVYSALLSKRSDRKLDLPLKGLFFQAQNLYKVISCNEVTLRGLLQAYNLTESTHLRIKQGDKVVFLTAFTEIYRRISIYFSTPLIVLSRTLNCLNFQH